MPTASERYSSAMSAFADHAPGAVAGCPGRAASDQSSATAAATATNAPVEFEKTFRMTQDIIKTMSGGSAAKKSKDKAAWIEIILVDNDGQPMPGVRYRITPPDGKPVEGRLNEHGQAGLYGIDPGNCRITFPDLDQDAWE